MRWMCALFLCLSVPFCQAADFGKISGLEKSTFVKILISPLQPDHIYAAADSAVFESFDRGYSWNRLFSRGSETIKDMAFHQNRFACLYVAAKEGLYCLEKEREEKIFSPLPEQTLTAVAHHRGTIYVGTDQGVYVGDESGLRFRKARGIPDAAFIYAFDFSGDQGYVVTDSGIYIKGRDDVFTRGYVLKGVSREEGDDENEVFILPRVIKKERTEPGIVYLGTSRGLYLSYDNGLSFERFTASPLDRVTVYCVLLSDRPGFIYLGTSQGIYAADRQAGSVTCLSRDMPFLDVFWLDKSFDNRLFAATDNGLFREISAGDKDRKEYALLEKILKMLPSIEEIQQQALRYNEVQPEKIEKWRKAFKYRAFFPTVSLDYDKSVYGSSSGQFAVGPRDWGVSFSWDAGDLVWNSYEDDVDTRSRLNTQLRSSILDDINNVYFERLRIELELAGKEGLNEQQRCEKKLRLKELSAVLDGYTGGYFSRASERLVGK